MAANSVKVGVMVYSVKVEFVFQKEWEYINNRNSKNDENKAPCKIDLQLELNESFFFKFQSLSIDEKAEESLKDSDGNIEFMGSFSISARQCFLST